MTPLAKWPEELQLALNNNSKLWSNLKTVDVKNVAPRTYDILNAFKYTPFNEVKVLILGQDPYIRGEAHGLAFSSQTSITPSLEIIFKELHNDLGIQRSNPNLIDWAGQGVLLLNTILTTEIGKSLAHESFGWQDFTKKAMQLLIARQQPLVVMLWGRHAKDTWAEAEDSIRLKWSEVTANKFILSTNHPVAEHRNPNGKYLFTGNKHFSQANNWLVKQGLEPIKW